MQIKALASKPKLTKIIIDEDFIVEQYGEPLEFHVWDRQPIEKFLKFAGQTITPEMIPELVKLCEEMILDEDGNQVLVDDLILPNDVMMVCISKTMETLGKSQKGTSTKKAHN